MSKSYSLDKMHPKDWRALRTIVMSSDLPCTKDLRTRNQLDWQTDIIKNEYFMLLCFEGEEQQRLGVAGFQEKKLCCYIIKKEFQQKRIHNVFCQHLKKQGFNLEAEDYAFYGNLTTLL